MLSLDYGSDSENEDISSNATTSTNAPPSATRASGKPSFNLPLPTANSSSVKAKKMKKIAIALPGLPKPHDSDTIEEPPAKKPRVAKESGAGVSSLLSMLPAPKQPANALPPRVLGGGGKGKALQFSAAPSEPTGDSSLGDGVDYVSPEPTLSLRPASLARGRTNVNLELDTVVPRTGPSKPVEPAVDFFSIDATSSYRSSAPSITKPSLFPSVSSAPKIETFEPPEPTPEDEYPGYYKLPTGDWAAYDLDYYKKFYDKWKKEYDAHVRALEKGMRGFEDYDQDRAAEVDAAAEMERAKVEVKEREERKALTTGDASGETAKPNMNIQGAKLGRVARSRHQLTTLLTEAYMNRDALEERIAQGKRNRKEAGTKYGF